ncbi:alpha/beta hydrolase [Luteimonas sp. RD2P54]|uniref:Alpha/beta hydrolase n=1 Tax=Luteimonas endophytica TaxID=3042023 RepID=A0ABT6JD54_9GAMM|nr:alpha/beta hydrolase [Luteimonas endophytica]MDH5824689.1 alpha/beta hydrolase [Luteimonas endophytica]
MRVPVASAVAGAALAAAGAVAIGIALWRDPWRLVRAEYARQRRALGLRRRSRVIDGLRWTWAEGDPAQAGAPTLLMLHGYTGSKENWYRLAARLRGRYRLLIPDLPGWGDSQRRADGDHGYAAEAAMVAGFARAVTAGPVVLLGHSMGGGIAAVLAARHPELVARLVLLDASGVEFGENRFGLEVLDGGNPFRVDDAASLERYLTLLFHQRSARPPIPWPAAHAVIAFRRRQAGFEQSVLDRIGRGPERFLPGEEAARIRQPTLLVWGAHDRVIDPSALEMFGARIPHARRLLLDGSGHMALMEQPDAVAAAVTALIEEAPA